VTELDQGLELRESMTMVHAAIEIAENAPFIGLVLYAFFSHPNQKKTTSSEDGSVRFDVDPPIIWLCLICIPMLLYWAIMAWIKLDIASNYLALIYGICDVVAKGGLGIGLLISLPGKLIVTADGIEQQFWVKSNRQVSWGQIATIIVGEYRVEVAAANGKKVVHERFHLDREGFLSELKKYCIEKDFAERLDQNIAMVKGKGLCRR